MFKTLVRIALAFHQFGYKLASALAIKAEGGLHPKHRLMDYHRFFLDRISPGDTVLDIGCGNGALAYDLAKKARTVVGIDTNVKNQKAWKEKYRAPNITYVLGDATTTRFDQTFDVIVLSNVLEHIEHRVEFLEKIKRLAPLLLIRVPMINRDWITLYKKELGLDYMLDKTHFVEYTLDAFRDELASAGLSIQEHSIQFGEIWATTKCVGLKI